MVLKKLIIDSKSQLDAMTKDNVVVNGTEIAPEVKLSQIEMPSLSHWKMNDNAATSVVVDSIGTHNGIFYRGTSEHNTDQHSVPGKINTALSFARGSNDRVDCGQVFVNPSCTAISVSLWVYKTSDTSDQGAFYIGNLGGTLGKFQVVVYLSLNRIEFGMNSNDFLETTEYSGYVGAWHHIVAKYDGSYGYLIIDDVEKIKVAYTTPLDLTGMGTHIGVYYKANDGRGFDGNIDDVRIYDEALTPEQISFLYNEGNGTEEGIIGGDYISPGILTSNSEKIDAITLGMLRWVEELPAGTDVTFATRTGPTETPDAGWSAWSGEMTNPVTSQMTSPPDVYIQFRATLTTTDTSKTPKLYRG